jgi:spore maturation protein CgeB
MKLLIVDTYYSGFLDHVYAETPGLKNKPYAEQWRLLMDQCFGTADFYSESLRPLGYEAHEVVPNCDPLQRRWAREYSPHCWAAYPLYRARGRRKDWYMAVLKAQVEKLKPDVLYIQDLNWMDTALLQAVRRKGRLIVGQTACALRPDLDCRPYDLVVSSFPHYVERFRQQGLKAEYLRFAFDPRVLARLGSAPPGKPVVFIGGYSAATHANGGQLLEQVASRVSVDFWGYGAESLPPTSVVHQSYHGEAWGLQMYRILAASRISLNRHSDVAGRFANNMRLFEATGVGTLLLTDWKDDLNDMFEVGKEVAAYRTPQECAELVTFYSDHEDERRAAARAGQERTLREHTYRQRMKELVDILRKHL